MVKTFYFAVSALFYVYFLFVAMHINLLLFVSEYEWKSNNVRFNLERSKSCAFGITSIVCGGGVMSRTSLYVNPHKLRRLSV